MLRRTRAWIKLGQFSLGPPERSLHCWESEDKGPYRDQRKGHMAHNGTCVQLLSTRSTEWWEWVRMAWLWSVANWSRAVLPLRTDISVWLPTLTRPTPRLIQTSPFFNDQFLGILYSFIFLFVVIFFAISFHLIWVWLHPEKLRRSKGIVGRRFIVHWLDSWLYSRVARLMLGCVDEYGWPCPSVSCIIGPRVHPSLL